MMFTLDGVQKFHSWTHSSLTLVLDHLSTIPPADYLRVLPNFGIRTLREQVIHVLNCEGVWIYTLQGLRYVDCKPLLSKIAGGGIPADCKHWG
jgi:hypothetical protein